MRAERGSALIMAMLVVVAAATLVSGALWQQSALIREAENELAYAQAKWLLRGAIDWAGVILQEDARTSAIDHRGEPWAVPLADTRLNENDGRPAAYLSGAIDDEQAKFNLRNLAAAQGIEPAELEALRRLLRVLRIDEALADRIAERVAASVRLRGEQADLGRAFAEELLPAGMEREAFARLLSFVTVLPEPTLLNVNTAPAELLVARIPELELLQAKRLIASRDRAPYKDIGDALSRLREVAPAVSERGLGVATRYFSIDGTVTYGRARLAARALVRREAARVEVLWVKETG